MSNVNTCGNPSHARIVGEGFCRICEKKKKDAKNKKKTSKEDK
jgi:hypothetical protein